MKRDGKIFMLALQPAASAILIHTKAQWMDEASNFEEKTNNTAEIFVYREKFQELLGSFPFYSLPSYEHNYFDCCLLLVYKFLGFIKTLICLCSWFSLLSSSSFGGWLRSFMAGNLNFIASLIIHLSFYI